MVPACDAYGQWNVCCAHAGRQGAQLQRLQAGPAAEARHHRQQDHQGAGREGHVAAFETSFVAHWRGRCCYCRSLLHQGALLQSVLLHPVCEFCCFIWGTGGRVQPQKLRHYVGSL